MPSALCGFRVGFCMNRVTSSPEPPPHSQFTEMKLVCRVYGIAGGSSAIVLKERYVSKRSYGPSSSLGKPPVDSSSDRFFFHHPAGPGTSLQTRSNIMRTLCLSLID